MRQDNIGDELGLHPPFLPPAQGMALPQCGLLDSVDLADFTDRARCANELNPSSRAEPKPVPGFG